MSIAAALKTTAERRHSAALAAPAYVIAAVLANLGLMYGIMYSSLHGRWDLLVAVQGIVVGQVFLLSLWMAFGANLAIVRLPVVVVIAFVLGHAVRLRLPNVPPWEGVLLVGGGVLTAILLVHWLLLPWRWLGGLRLGFRPPERPAAPSGRVQLRIRHLLAWTIWCAAPCALARIIGGDQAVEILFGIAIYGALGLPLALASAMLAFGRRKLLWLPAFVAAWGFSTGLKQLIPDFFDTPQIWQFNLAVVFTVGGTLAALRPCGLRLWRDSSAGRGD